jgi:hypothetical protein
MEKKKSISFNKEEAYYLKHFFWHFSDFACGDDRPDHGWNVLAFYRDADEDTKRELLRLAGKLARYYGKF